MALSHGLFISALRFKELEGFFSKGQEVWALFLQGRSTSEEKIDLSKRCTLLYPAFVFYFSPLSDGSKPPQPPCLGYSQPASFLIHSCWKTSLSLERWAIALSLLQAGTKSKIFISVVLFIAQPAWPSLCSPWGRRFPTSRREFAARAGAGGRRGRENELLRSLGELGLFLHL